jgi:hypothetical protein
MLTTYEKIRNKKTLLKIESALNKAVLEIGSFAIERVNGIEISERIFLYECVKLGYITKISKGNFKVNYSKHDIINIIEPVLRSYKANAKERRERHRGGKYKKQISADFKHIENHSNSGLNEANCIKYLKGLGYKIMKPIQQFEEI